MIRSKLPFMFIVLVVCCVISPSAYPKRHDKPFKIYMAVWRGCEDACRGFQDYFQEEGIEVKFIIRNANRDKIKLPAFVREAKKMLFSVNLSYER